MGLTFRLERPNRPHVASDEIVSVKGGYTFQPCKFCGVPLVVVETGRGRALRCYATGECIGTQCPGTRVRFGNEDP
jgi:ssDNA-binding Zn-finger/Zn-ribbon topoisomerase 1